MECTKRLGLARESYVILAICLLDLLLTAWLIGTNRATEGNPLMSFYLSNGWPVLVGIKVLLVAMPLFVAEWARRRRPQFVHRALRFAIAVYLGMYVIAFMNAGISASDSRAAVHSIATQQSTFMEDTKPR